MNFLKKIFNKTNTPKKNETKLKKTILDNLKKTNEKEMVFKKFTGNVFKGKVFC